MIGSNAAGGNGPNVSVHQDFAVFDRLPRSIKEMCWNYAYPLSALAVEAQANRFDALSGSDMAEMHFEDTNRRVLARFRDNQIAQRWPSGHPMIGQELKDDWT